MMQCPHWFNEPASSGQQYKIYSLFNRSCDCHSESSTVPAENLCFGVSARAILRVFVSGPLLQSRAAVGLQAAPPSRLKNSTCLSVLPPVSHLPACFSLPPCPSRLPCCTSLVSLSQSGSLPARVTPPLPSYRPVCIRSPDMHHTH